VETSIRNSSLLPYLGSGDNKFRLEISIVSQDLIFFEKSPFPFLLISDSNPLARLIEARILTDADSVIKRVFLLQQSDKYELTIDEMWPLNNADIDRFWREAFSKYSNQAEETSLDSSPLLIAGQINENGDIVPFQPLFYCIHKNVYFHPICPKCGNCLHLCENDDLLAKFDLIPYSTSLKRYLYCPECFQTSGQTEFYTINRKASDPKVVKDQLTLTSEVGDLIANSGTLNHFLANVWFYVLLVNKQHSVEGVRANLEKFLTQLAPGVESLTELVKKNGPDPIFSPENIYWNPEGKRVNQNWLEFL